MVESRNVQGFNLFITDAGILGVPAFFTGVKLKLDAEVLRLCLWRGFGLQDDLVAFPLGKLAGRDEPAVLYLEGNFGFAAWCFSGGGENFGRSGLSFHLAVIDSNANATVFFDIKFGLLAAEVKQETFARPGFDFGISKDGRGGKGGDE